jgi:2-polyprenyl-6-methoxyphenol hydroxylase-like FAD-dependent oxidoreductase
VARPRIGIIGGGIGGVALSGALRTLGLDSHIFERAPAFGEIGAGIQMTPNGVKVLRALGLWQPLSDVSFRPLCIVGRDWKTGHENFRTPLKDECPRLYGADFFHVHRVDLHRILTSLVPPDAVSFTMSCTSVRQTGRSTVATFADGSEFEADVLVGADGLHSVVRNALFGKESPRFTGMMCWRSVVPVPDGERLEFVSPDSSFWLGPHGHVVTYYVSGGRAVNLVAIRETDAWVEESWNVPSTREEMIGGFPDWHPDLQQLFSRADTVLKWGLWDRDPMPTWTSDRVTLLGDAAHPMLPFLSQGAAMAIEDAYVLARALAEADDPRVALKRYERLRLPRTSRVQLESRKRGQTYHRHRPIQKMLRNAVYRVRQAINPHKGGIQANWVYEYDATTESLEQGAATRP